ncbi:hypothetical protein HY389_01955 [Candidatus Daviesbacteria bacterium]|nr:hypothetical protein [Candidatus Daviesbacteria bacterium]
MPGNAPIGPAANQTVLLNGAQPQTADPYGYTVGSGTHQVSVSNVTGYTTGYTACTNSTNCHNNPPTDGSAVNINCPAGGYVDLWWHYTAQAPTPGSVTLNASSACVGGSPGVNGSPVVNLSWSQSPPQTDTYTFVTNSSMSPNTFINTYSAADNSVAPGSNYNYYISAYQSGFPVPNTSSNIVGVTTPWCDNSPPSAQVETVTNGSCYSPAGNPQLPNPIQVLATDTLSGVKRVSWSLTSSQGQVVAQGNAVLVSGSANAGYWNISLTPPGIDTYLLSATAYDNDNNISAPSTISFSYANFCGKPYIQTNQGDVHSNQNINIPGGPTPSP